MAAMIFYIAYLNLSVLYNLLILYLQEIILQPVKEFFLCQHGVIEMFFFSTYADLIEFPFTCLY